MLSRRLPFTAFLYRGGGSASRTCSPPRWFRRRSLLSTHSSIIPFCSSSPQISAELADTIPQPPSKQGPIGILSWLNYHKFNEAQRGQTVLKRLKEGEIVVLISDSTMLGISDPDTELVRVWIFWGLGFCRRRRCCSGRRGGGDGLEEKLGDGVGDRRRGGSGGEEEGVLKLVFSNFNFHVNP
ncbi:hypothetical protein DVH24_021065 [Malus domestica]|uniref:Uncharacterized protein n=1 Tax=Malus domestica TaxID=3750 RepID=A0A498JE86_MALDO|nr:hypothetical protein DVH24_021065 [Malus domestica]